MERGGKGERERGRETETSDFVSTSEPVCSQANVHCFMASNSFDPGQVRVLTTMNQVRNIYACVHACTCIHCKYSWNSCACVYNRRTYSAGPYSIPMYIG